MDQVLGLRAFVPAKDFDLSKRFYGALGFSIILEEERVAIFRRGAFSFILQRFYHEALAQNLMLQLMLHDLDAWWAEVAADTLPERFTVKAPTPPAMQDWGLRVGFVFDPSGVLWHAVQAPF